MRTIVITGATGDIARELIRQLSDDRLILLSRNVSALETLVDHQNLHLYQVDLSDEAALSATCQAISDKFGAVDILVNNAGYGDFKSFLSFSDTEIKQMFAVNVFALMQVTRSFLPNMLAQKSGQIVNIASIASHLPTAKSSIYAASKFAVRGFSDALRQEVVADNIKVLVVNTGPVKTKFHADNPDYLKKVGKNAVTAAFVAQKIVRHLGSSKRELNLPWQFNIARIFASIFPTTTDKITRRFFNLK
ncbi:SDR family NAD(P)-dependent oxidoreductase [Lactococcus insecticola]|uniref:Short-chain dehydrogenase n=1 Tax=Pseudolactococcus insecticola TaxID=2709158 RepID=A0A6A0B8P5_9LACT|nr:SDR family oxidoreductase [Lactococcus insecticola]GFH41206.1 short-chain dehydrogenase [Lactococcus insecticola]